MDLAPELDVSEWLNAAAGPPTLAALRGKVVLVHAFQMLCPGCVMHALPQAKRVHEALRRNDFAVLGLHSVFEHHEAMTPVSLEAFLHEYRIAFPVAVDAPGEGRPIPKTMAAYGMRGTPTTIVIDPAGRIARHSFGAEDDLAFGLFLGDLAAARSGALPAAEAGICKIDEGCA